MNRTTALAFLRTVGRWWAQGGRVALLRAPRWAGLEVTPAVLALLAAAPVAVMVAGDRLSIDGPAVFQPAALLQGWLQAAVLAWTAWLLARWPRTHAAEVGGLRLVALMAALSLWLALLTIAVDLATGRFGGWLAQVPDPGVDAAQQVPLVWAAVSLSVLLRRAVGTDSARRGVALIAMLALAALTLWLPAWTYWDTPEAPAAPRATLTQEITEAQAALLPDVLDALPAGRPHHIDVYGITFAPDGEDDVFLNEERLVATLLRERFGAEDRTVELANDPDTATSLPWATPLNLQRAIAAAGERMNLDEDVLFLHLTSHGARDGRLAASLDGMTVEEVTPQDLRQWLDAAGIRWRVISISACFSGSWIEPLRGPGTLVMTAADANHTSYGCGRGSELTFFGRAMYAEQLRTSTRDFERAFAVAREVIRRREIEAGKTDGYSNPQIAMGADVRPVLHALEAQLVVEERHGPVPGSAPARPAPGATIASLQPAR
jgi:hypothetical protein